MVHQKLQRSKLAETTRRKNHFISFSRGIVLRLSSFRFLRIRRRHANDRRKTLFIIFVTTMNMVNHSVIIATSCVPLINSTMRTVLHFYFWQRKVKGDIFLVLADWLIKIFWKVVKSLTYRKIYCHSDSTIRYQQISISSISYWHCNFCMAEIC